MDGCQSFGRSDRGREKRGFCEKKNQIDDQADGQPENPRIIKLIIGSVRFGIVHLPFY